MGNSQGKPVVFTDEGVFAIRHPENPIEMLCW
jgi:hypothetical protein